MTEDSAGSVQELPSLMTRLVPTQEHKCVRALMLEQHYTQNNNALKKNQIAMIRY